MMQNTECDRANIRIHKGFSKFHAIILTTVIDKQALHFSFIILISHGIQASQQIRCHIVYWHNY